MPRRNAMLGRNAILSRNAVWKSVVAALVIGGSGLPSSRALAADAPSLESRLTKLGYSQGEQVDRINDYRVDAWNYLDDRHIMIYTGVSSRALITTLTSCPELSGVEHIGFSTTARNLTKFDKIVVRGTGGIRRDCQISQIHELTKIKKE